jgi:hypothetical protein
VIALGVSGSSAACGSDPSEAARDASIDVATTDVALDRGATSDSGSPSLFGDAGFDAYVAWCEAGAPQIEQVQPCSATVIVPCGLPQSFEIDDAGMIGRSDCVKICPLDAGPLQGCDIACGPTCQGLDAAYYDGSAVEVLCDLCTSGRRPGGLIPTSTVPPAQSVGQWAARAAYLEEAAVTAFRELRDELRALGAPRSMVAAATRFARDEVRHAKAMRSLALRRGSVPERPRFRRTRRRSLLEMAVENMAEGCVRETYGALLARWQSIHAGEPDVAKAMARIAEEELLHAALGWAITRWAAPRMTATERDHVRRARDEAVAGLRVTAGREASPAVARAVGLPTRRTARTLLDGLFEGYGQRSRPLTA